MTKLDFDAIRKAYPETSVINDDLGAFKEDGTQITLVQSDIDAARVSLNNLEPMRLLRAERNKRLSACDWRASSDLTLSDSWKTYRQALRDLPASATPKLDSNYELDMTSVTFPTEPS